MIELASILFIIGTGLGFWIGQAIETRRWQRDAMARRAFAIRH